MSRNLCWITITAKTPMAIIPIAKMVNAMAMIQSVSPIEIAAKSERNWFVATVAWLIVGALVTGLLAVLLYKKTGKYQEALKADADARIEEAKRGAEEARKDAAAANERSKQLELRIEEESRKRAEAEERLERVRKKVSARGITNAQPLYEGSKGAAIILFEKDDPEAYTFA